MNCVVATTHRTGPGSTLCVAELVQAGDILRVGTERAFHVHVMDVYGTGPYTVRIGNFESISRHVMAGEPVEVINHIGHQERR